MPCNNTNAFRGLGKSSSTEWTLMVDNARNIGGYATLCDTLMHAGSLAFGSWGLPRGSGLRPGPRAVAPLHPSPTGGGAWQAGRDPGDHRTTASERERVSSDRAPKRFSAYSKNHRPDRDQWLAGIHQQARCSETAALDIIIGTFHCKQAA